MADRPNPRMKQTVRDYYADNAVGHACHVCRKPNVTLYKLGKDRNHHTVYGCSQHRDVR